MQGGSENRTSEDLKRWNAGDAEGLKSLLENHLPWIEKYVRKRLGARIRRKAETQDFVQDAMVQFLRYGPRIEVSSETHFRALIGRIVENVLADANDRINALRRRISQERPLPSDTVLQLNKTQVDDSQPPGEIQKKESEAWIQLGIELLSPEDREVLILRAYGNMTFQEIGKEIGIPENTARMRYQRALPRLAEKVGRLRRGDLDGVLKDDQGAG